MTEQIIVQKWPGCYRFISRARLTRAPSDGVFTDVGRAVEEALSKIDGMTVGSFQGYAVNVFPTHELPWPWAGVQAQIVAVFAEALGAVVEVIAETHPTAAE